jgi:phosphatidylglycerol:prolipoprotein diacylglycerol transferase
MLPKIILFNHLVISFYGFFVSLGVIGALLLFYKSAPYRDINPKIIINFAIIMVVFGVIGSRLFFVLFNWNLFKGGSWLKVAAFWRGGLMFQGGPVLAIVAAPFFLAKYKLRFWEAADVIAPSLALGQGIGRIGCFFAGCCYGRETSPANPLAVIFPYNSIAPANTPLWPTQLAESICLLALSGFLFYSLKLSSASARRGKVAGIYLLGAGLTRFIIEFFRGDDRGRQILGWPPTTIISCLIGLGGLVLLCGLAARPTILTREKAEKAG